MASNPVAEMYIYPPGGNRFGVILRRTEMAAGRLTIDDADLVLKVAMIPYLILKIVSLGLIRSRSEEVRIPLSEVLDVRLSRDTRGKPAVVIETQDAHYDCSLYRHWLVFLRYRGRRLEEWRDEVLASVEARRPRRNQ